MIGSLANRSASDGIGVFPNLGYKKDAFLEPSMVNNNFSPYPTNHHPHSYYQHHHLILDSAMSSNNLQQQQPQQPSGPPGLSAMSSSFVPRGPTGPLPVDSLGRLARLVQEGGEMRGNTFITRRGNQISHPHGHCLPLGHIRGPYPRIDEVSKGI